MEISIDVINEVTELLSEKIINFFGLTRKTFQVCELDEKNVSISVLLTDDRIRKINNDYRQKDSVTDVISFPLLENIPEAKSIQRLAEMPLELGDIIINVAQAIRQKEDYGHSLEREISFLYVHGLLHLLQYDHQNEKDEEVMCKLQEEILNEFCKR